MATLTTTINYSEPAGSIIVTLATPGPAGPGVPPGGSANQVLAKIDGVSYNTEWVTPQDDSAVWGQITGNLPDQGDLQGALDAKLDSSTAASTYYLQTNPLGFITASALAPYLPLAGGYITGDIQSLNGSEFRTFQSPNSAIIRPNQIQLGDAVGSITVDAGGITFNSSALKQTTPFLGLEGYATESWVNTQLGSYLTISSASATYYPLTNPSGFITAAALAGYATESWVTSQGYLTSAALVGYATESWVGLNYYPLSNPSGYISDAPSDGSTYGRNNGTWAVAGGGGTWGSITGTLSDQTDLQGALDAKYDATNPSGFINSVNGLTPSFDYSVTVSNPPAPDNYSVSEWDRLKFYFPDPMGGAPSFLEYRTDGVFKSDGQEMYPKRTGGSFVGKLLLNQTTQNAGLNIGQTQGNVPSSTLAGDVWILDNINFKSSNGTAKVVANTNTANTFSQPQIITTGTTATLPALRITNQSTTGVSLLVEDTTNPDVNSFVVDASGNLGVGVAVGYTASQKLEVVGNVKADGFLNGAGPVFTVKSVSAHAVGPNTHDIFMSVGGSTYRIPAIFVSTP